MKIIKMFIASSVVEFQNEREQLGNYVRRLNDIYAPQDTYIQLVPYEDFQGAIAQERKQEAYADQVRESQYFYVIFGADADQTAIEEFDVALEQFKACGAPKLYTYFRTVAEGEKPSRSVLDFMNRLDKEIGHYYCMFSHLDSVKLNMLIELSKSPELQGKLEFVDSQAVLDGTSVLSLENVPMFSKNETVLHAKAELERLNGEFAAAAVAYAANINDTEVYNKLSDLGAQRAELAKQLHTLEMDIFGLFQAVSGMNNSERQLTWREKKAVELVDAGEYEGALNILRDAQREQKIAQTEELGDAVNNRVRDHISEYRLRVDILKARGVTAESAEEITDCYEASVKLAEKHHVALDILYAYANFLHGQKQFARGLEIAERLRKWYELDGVTDAQRADVLNLSGILLNDTNQKAEAEKQYREALEIRRGLAEHNSAYESLMADTCNNLATLLNSINEKSEAQTLCREALEIRRRLAERNPATYKQAVASTCNNLAGMLNNINEKADAEKLYREALEIYRSLAERNPAANKSGVPNTCNNLANLLSSLDQNAEAEKLHCEALEIRKRLAERNPVTYDADVVQSCENLAMFDLSKKRGLRRSQSITGGSPRSFGEISVLCARCTIGA